MSQIPKPYILPQINNELLEDKQIKAAYLRLIEIIKTIEVHPVPEKGQEMVQACLTIIDRSHPEKEATLKALEKSTNTIIKLLKKHMGFVPKNHYTLLGSSLGMAIIGLPAGIIISTIMGNLAYIGVGLPLGLLIGLLLGWRLDSKAAEQGKQLPI